MDEEIRKIKKSAQKEVKALGRLEKEDKKHDKIIEKAKQKLKKK